MNLNADITYITPNKRLASALRERYDQAQTTTAWPSLNVLPYDTWLTQTWYNIFPSKTLLSDFEATLIWESIIKQSDAVLLSNPATLAKDAYERLKRWLVTLEQEAFLSNEVQQFVEWKHAFEAHCEEHQLIDKTCLLNELIDTLEQPICLIGFNELTPEQQYLLERHPNATQQEVNFKKNETCKAYAFEDRDTEIKAMADWALQQFKTDKNVACIIPELTQLRGELETEFKKTFKQGFDHVNISAGIALSDYPIIRTVLTLLSLHSSLDQEDLSFALTSPFLGESTEELSERFKMDVYLREHKRTHKAQLLRLSEKLCPKLFERLNAFFELDTKTKRNGLAWAHYFSDALHALGWPGERVLNSLEYQTVAEFNRQLDVFSKLNDYQADISHWDALNLLKKLCQQSIFQGQSLAYDVQVLGVLEAAGLEFDAIWIMGLDDQTWPPAAKPSPFLPIAFQREHNMPHASAAKELSFTKHLTEQIKQSATEVVFSYAHEQHQKLPSQLIPVKDFATYALETETLKPCTLEQLDDFHAQEYTETIIKGSTQTLKYQAQCPFKAFAYQRLNADSLPTADVGISPINRGVILHEALHLIWQQLKDQDTLLAQSDEALQQIISDCLNMAMKDIHIETALKQLEFKRSLTIIQSWLSFEKRRPGFSIVATEAERLYTLEGKQFKARLDRIDQLDNGDLCLIDYKTGATTTADWYGERPTEPQLPFYATCEEDTKAIAFADLRAGKQTLKGTSYNTTQIKSIKQIDYWPEQLSQWQNECTKLLNDFCAGDAAVDPKTPAACATCDLHGICRIFEEETVHG